MIKKKIFLSLFTIIMVFCSSSSHATQSYTVPDTVTDFTNTDDISITTTQLDHYIFGGTGHLDTLINSGNLTLTSTALTSGSGGGGRSLQLFTSPPILTISSTQGI